jgi:hypothetical protein
MNFAARDAARFSTQPTNDSVRALRFISAIRDLVDADLLAAGVTADLAPSRSGRAGSTFGMCPNSELSLLPSTVDLCCASPNASPAVQQISTHVDLQYPYQWQFSSVIGLVAPGTSYAGITVIDTDAFIANQTEMRQLDNQTAGARRQRGQTIALVAVAILGFLAMAALAIDLTTLYVAHGEIQRAADAAALAGAKAFVDSGVTTSPSNTSLQTLAQTMATDFATAVVSQNHVRVASTVHKRNATGKSQHQHFWKPKRAR